MSDYDELIAKMDDLDIALSNGFGKAETIIGSIKAVRAVIELHNCTSKYCGNCGMASPCFTIEAIARELQ